MDFMACRIKPFKYVKVTSDDFENFEEIIRFISSPIPEPNIVI
jgi:hypothetical protein